MDQLLVQSVGLRGGDRGLQLFDSSVNRRELQATRYRLTLAVRTSDS